MECRCTNKDEVEMLKKKNMKRQKKSPKYSFSILLGIKPTSQEDILAFTTNQTPKEHPCQRQMLKFRVCIREDFRRQLCMQSSFLGALSNEMESDHASIPKSFHYVLHRFQKFNGKYKSKIFFINCETCCRVFLF